MAAPRGHRTIDHTADVGLTASAPDLPALFEEAALALAEIASDVGAQAISRSDDMRAGGDHAIRPGPLGEIPGTTTEAIALDARDLAALAFAWLNELIGLADARRAAFVDATVEAVREDRGAGVAESSASGGVGPGEVADVAWRLAAIARFAPFGPLVRARLGVKSATYHRLAVAHVAGGWTLTAYLDV